MRGTQNFRGAMFSGIGLEERVTAGHPLRKLRVLVIEDKRRGHSTFSANRERLVNEDLVRVFFERVKSTAQWAKLTSDEHFRTYATTVGAPQKPGLRVDHGP